MIAIARFEIALSEAATFAGDLDKAHAALAECAGYIDGEVGQDRKSTRLNSSHT